jgi:NAD(P)-dependent dehydrogenase (short-subunit alcohol dehydrogenase family)
LPIFDCLLPIERPAWPSRARNRQSTIVNQQSSIGNGRGAEQHMNLDDARKFYDFTGRAAVITGGSGVLGARMVQAVAGCGARVAVLARNPAKAESVLSSTRVPEHPLIVEGDVLKPETLRQALQRVMAELGRVDFLVNVAGGNHPQAVTRPDLPFFDLPEEAIRYAFDLNILGTLLPCQIFGRQMAQQGEGVILNVSSMSSFRPLTRVVAYSAAKAAVNNFTQWLAVHLAQEYSTRIRVNTIAPGFFLTEQNRFLLTDEQTGQLTARGLAIIQHTPMQRFGQPDDLLGTLLWLLSPASSFVTGIVVPVDGGFSAYGGV